LLLGSGEHHQHQSRIRNSPLKIITLSYSKSSHQSPIRLRGVPSNGKVTLPLRHTNSSSTRCQRRPQTAQTMCHQITYKLPCEHIRADVVYCADAPAPAPDSTPSTRSSGYDFNAQSASSSKRGDHHHSGKKHSSKGKDRQLSSSKFLPLSSSSANKRKACRNLTRQSIAYPMPPSFEGDPSMAALSPLLPKCPLPRCPFEALNRCWNCCWCGKGWNEQGRCSCIMIIEGNQVRCEHICCETCTTAGAM
jgi:hypothetical protein